MRVGGREVRAAGFTRVCNALHRATIAAALAFALVVCAGAAAAAPPPIYLTHAYSPYERETIAAVFGSLATTEEPSPEGKTIEAVDVVPLDVIEPRDPAPRALNALHVTTRPYVILREMLVREGEPYRAVLLDESARNLRTLPQLSLVLCVAARGHDARHVRVVVITKDVWSLLVDFDIAFGNGGLLSLDLEPKEKNLFGTQDAVLARLTMTPLTYSLGAGYIVPRLEGRRLALQADANVVANRDTGDVEGSFGTVTLARPLYSAQTQWSAFTGVAWDDRIFRRYVNGSVATYAGVPYAYRARRIAEEAAVTRSFGWGEKNDFTLGAEIARDEYRAGDAVSEAALASQIPVGEARVGPFVQWRAYSASYTRVVDVETLGLQEDYALGHDVVVRAYPVLAALGSTRTFGGLYAAAQQSFALGDGFARVGVESTTEGDASSLTDASVEGSLRIVTPRFGIGRFVFDVDGLDRYRNHLNLRSFLGGDTRLRGFPTSFFVGQDVVAMNFEYRTLPWKLTTIHIAGDAFYDVGDAFDSPSLLRPQHAVGFGARLLFPQIDRIVFRIDVGFPIVPGGLPAGVDPVQVFFAFHQAFAVPSIGGPLVDDAPSPTPTIGGGLGD
jgi:hypothetical protein